MMIILYTTLIIPGTTFEHQGLVLMDQILFIFNLIEIKSFDPLP